MAQAGFATQTDLARAAGINETTVGRWIRGEKEPTVVGLRAIAPPLGVRLGDLMIRAGLASREELGTVGSPPPPGPPLPAVLRSVMARLANPRLTERQKRALLAHLERSIDMFDDMLDEMASAPREPRMRSR